MDFQAKISFDADFWQGAPRSLEVRGAGTDMATTTLWAYSPKVSNKRCKKSPAVLSEFQAPAMDMRHYDTVPHGVRLPSFGVYQFWGIDQENQLDLAYEDVGNPDPNPIGVGRSYEFTLQLFSATPSRATLSQLSVVHVSLCLVKGAIE